MGESELWRYAYNENQRQYSLELRRLWFRGRRKGIKKSQVFSCNDEIKAQSLCFDVHTKWIGFFVTAIWILNCPPKYVSAVVQIST